MREWIAKKMAGFDLPSVRQPEILWRFDKLECSSDHATISAPAVLPDFLRALRQVSVVVFEHSVSVPATVFIPLPIWVEPETHPCNFVEITRISDNLLLPLGVPKREGKNYKNRENLLFDEDTAESVKKDPRKHEDSAYRKAYTENRDGPHPSRSTLDFWDQLLPLLKPPLTIENPTGFNLPGDLFEFQWDGVKSLVSNRAFLLADEMGTGKTVMTCVALRLLFQTGKIKNALIVCPLSILGVWDRHLRDWAPELSVTVVHGTADRRGIDWRCPAHVYITTYGSLRGDLDSKNESLLNYVNGESTWGAVIADEAHHIKNPAASQTRAVHDVSRHSANRWALTGTPIQNGREDLHCIFRFLDPTVLPKNVRHVRNMLAKDIKALIEPFFLRRRKQDVFKTLPAKLMSEVWLDLNPDQKAEYDRVLGIERTAFTSGKKEFTKVHFFTLLQKLKQICNFAPGKGESPKTDALREHVEEVVANEKKVLVFTQFVTEGVEKLAKVLEEYGVVTITGETSAIDRKRSVEEFQKETGKRIFLATVKTAGEGLTLTAASFVIHFDQWWNPAAAWQAEDRAHRHGQKETVNVYTYWMKNTIEERIYKILRKKGLLHEEIINSLSETEFEEGLTIDDLLGILDLNRSSVRMGDKKAGDEETGVVGIRQKIQGAAPAEFVKIVHQAFVKALGYVNAKIIDGPGDGGIDIQASKTTPGGVERIAIQCKHMNQVGPGVARDLLGVLKGNSQLAKAYLVVSGTFTKACREACQDQGQIALMDGTQLARLMAENGIEIGR